MAFGNHNLDETLRLLSKEVDFRTFVKLKALTNASDSEFLNGQLFEFFRKRDGDIPFSEVLSLPSEANAPVKTRLLHWLVRWREALHSAIGEIKWGLSRGMGEDLAEYLAKAMRIADKCGDLPAALEVLGLERQVVMNYWATGKERSMRLASIQAQRQIIIDRIKAGDFSVPQVISQTAVDAETSRRVKSDLLFRLCSTLTDQECEELKRHIQLHRKDAKQFRLLEYYRQMAKWSREQEKKDWTGENLSQLKSNTLAWLMRNMSKYGDWHGKELHHLKGDLNWAVSKGIERHLESHFEKASRLAVEIEAFEAALDLHRVGFDCFPKSDRPFDLEAWAIKGLEEIEAAHALRLEYFEPIRIQNKDTGFNHIEAWREFQSILAISRWDKLSASVAAREVAKFRILAYMSLKKHNDGAKAAAQLITLHSNRPEIAASDWVRYFEELRLCCLALVLAGNHNEALALVNQMDGLEVSNKTVLPHSILQRLLALSYVYDATLDPALAELGLKLFANASDLISKADDGQRKIWLLSFIGKAALDLGRFDIAKESLNEILDKKVIAPTILVAHSRVRLLFAYLGSLVETEVIVNAATACLVYLKRNQAPQYLQQVAHLVKKVSQFEMGSIELQAALENAAVESEKFFSEERRGQGFNLNYPKVFRNILQEIKSYQ